MLLPLYFKKDGIMANVDNLTVKLHVNVKTLRDEFAIAALAGLLAQSPSAVSATHIAQEAYVAADAMMEARKS